LAGASISAGTALASEFGRSDARPVPKESEPEKKGPSVNFILSMPDGTTKPTSFEEAQKVFCNFPRRDTYQPPAEQGKSSAVSEPDGESFDTKVDDVGDASPAFR
jgi:hypothetical protein